MRWMTALFLCTGKKKIKAFSELSQSAPYKATKYVIPTSSDISYKHANVYPRLKACLVLSFLREYFSKSQ